MTDATAPGRILVVDDEVNIRGGLQTVLVKDGHTVRDAATAEAALSLLASFDCEVAIVDIRMPGMSGTELLAIIRGRWPHIAVILLTGHGTLETAMSAVREGAHDYLLKPAPADAIRETVIRALAASRRQREEAHLIKSLHHSLQRLEALPAVPPGADETAVDRQPIVVGEIEIDRRAHQVRLGGEPLDVTPTEYNLLVALASRPGEVIDYVTLVQLSLEYKAEPWEARELIKRHVFTLRQKIEPDPSNPHYLLNVRGVGYRLVSS
ncbi:MAG TPA: response regulator transcription factor [Anaerolineae bacterium]